MPENITITAMAKIRHDEDADSIAAELATELLRAVNENEAFGPVDGVQYAPEIRLDHYFAAKPPHYLPLRETRITVQLEVLW